MPIELGASPGGVGALIEQEHLGEVVAQARPGLLGGAGDRARSAGVVPDEGGDLVAVLLKLGQDVRPDEARSAGECDSHGAASS